MGKFFLKFILSHPAGINRWYHGKSRPLTILITLYALSTVQLTLRIHYICSLLLVQFIQIYFLFFFLGFSLFAIFYFLFFIFYFLFFIFYFLFFIFYFLF